jgi:hypothetical protein
LTVAFWPRFTLGFIFVKSMFTRFYLFKNPQRFPISSGQPVYIYWNTPSILSVVFNVSIVIYASAVV